jgi:flagellar hook-length control protein FliK
MSDAIAMSPNNTPVQAGKRVNRHEDPANSTAESCEFGNLLEGFIPALSGSETPSKTMLPAIETAEVVTDLPQPGTDLPMVETNIIPPVAMPVLMANPTVSHPESIPLAQAAVGISASGVGPQSSSGRPKASMPQSNQVSSEQPLLDTVDGEKPDALLLAKALPLGDASPALEKLLEPGVFQALISDANTTADSRSTLATWVGAMPSARPAALAVDAQLPVQTPHFGERFAQQITVLVEHGLQQARLSVNPPELGPIDVRISFKHDEASVQLASQHGAVREVMVEALPRLRELIESSGLRLNDSGVFAQLPQREQAASGQAQQASNELERVRRGQQEESPVPEAPAAYTLRLVDAYA